VKVMRVPDGVPSGVESVLWPGGCYDGGQSWDARYLVGGLLPQVYILDVHNPAALPFPVHRQTFTDTVTGADTTFYNQTDGASASGSRVFTNVALYWDFGTSRMFDTQWRHPTLSGFAQGIWEQHELLFISDNAGRTLRYYVAPADAEMQDTATLGGTHKAVTWNWSAEWTNHPYFATAPVRVDRVFKTTSPSTHTYHGEVVYLINLRDSTYLKVLESEDVSLGSQTSMRWARAWIEVPQGFEEDSTWLADALGARSRTRPDVRRSQRVRADQTVLYDLMGRRVGTATPATTSGVLVHRMLNGRVVVEVRGTR
jgi:hypothetical protein